MNKRILISLIAIGILASGVGYAMWQNQSGTANEEFSEEQLRNDEVDEKISEDETEQVEKEPDGEVNKPEAEEPTEQSSPQPAAEHSITINSWGYRDNEVYVNAMADSATSGTCTLNLSKGGQKVTTRATLQQSPTGYYACALRIGRSRIPSAGNWQARVTLSNDGGTSESQIVEVKVQ